MRYILFLDKEGNEVRKIQASEFGEEGKLQNMILNHPEVLSIPSIGKIVPLTTEYYAGSGLVDLIAFDEGGRIYIIETKLSKNTDRRKALAQLIEYASQIARYDTFEDFKEKIWKKAGKTLEEIVEENFGGNGGEVLDRLEENFNNENFVLVHVMDEFDDVLEDMVLFMNRHSKNLTILGVELRRYVIEGKGEVFAPRVIGAEVQKKESRRESHPITRDEFIRRYSEAGLGEIAEKIIRTFENAEEKYDIVRLNYRPKVIYLHIGKAATIEISGNPDGYYGVWVWDPALYERVAQIGNNLGLETRIPPAGKSFGKVIIFNKEEGIKIAADRLEVLINELVKLVKSRSLERVEKDETQ